MALYFCVRIGVRGGAKRASLLANARTQNKEISFQFFVGSSPHPSSENRKARIFLCFWIAASSSEKFHSSLHLFERLSFHLSTSSRRVRRALIPNVRGKSNIRSHTPAPPHRPLTGYACSLSCCGACVCSLARLLFS